MTSADDQPAPLARVPTGIAGLDTVLEGGLFRGGLYMVVGHPGTGKTILGNQVCFAHVAAGGRAVYVTLLAESHGRMLAHLRSLAFFQTTAVADAVFYVSGFGVLQREGLDGLLTFLRGVVRERRASLVVIDGLVTAQEAAPSVTEYKRFLHQLQLTLEALGCTTLLLTQGDADVGDPVHTLVDGVLALTHRVTGPRASRELVVHKFRGSGFLEGHHPICITTAGLAVYPRTEAVLVARAADPSPPFSEKDPQCSVGVRELDSMLRGGLPAGSTTMLVGSPGSGKTVLGLHFLAAGVATNEPGVYVGFHEPPAQLLAKARGVGRELDAAVADGRLVVLWEPPLELLVEPLVERLLAAVQAAGVRRVVIDGISSLARAVQPPERFAPFVIALSLELRRLGATTIIGVELPQLWGPEVSLPVPGLADATDNLLFLRFVELRSQLYRLVSILKLSQGGYDPAIREFRITDQGIEVAATFASAEAILTGVARPLHGLSLETGGSSERDTPPPADGGR